MKKWVATTLLYLLIGLPVSAQDVERIQVLNQELEARGIKQYLLIFENYLNFGGTDDLMQADSTVDSLNALTAKYKTVNGLHRLTNELKESGYYQSDESGVPLLLLNLNGTLEIVKSYGFGSGTLGDWQFKHMIGACGRRENVYYTTVKHPTRKFTFGFMLSAGYGYVDGKLLAGKDLKEPCY